MLGDASCCEINNVKTDDYNTVTAVFIQSNPVYIYFMQSNHYFIKFKMLDVHIRYIQRKNGIE